MASSASTPTPPDQMLEDDETADLPLTMAASVILDTLPKDAHAALETASEVRDANGEVKGKGKTALGFRALDLIYYPCFMLFRTAMWLTLRAVKVRLSPLPNTKPLRPPVFNCGTGQRFEFVVRFIRRRLGLKDHENVFCYVNSVFAPGLDEGVGNLWRVSTESHGWLVLLCRDEQLMTSSASRLAMSWW
jgi:ubiquitin-like protein ATG12